MEHGEQGAFVGGEAGGLGPDEMAASRQAEAELQDERDLLSAMTSSRAVVADVLNVVSAGDFRSPAHGLVFLAVLEAYAGDGPLDPAAVSVALAARGDLEAIGGAAAFDKVMPADARAGRAVKRAHRVRQAAVRRRLAEAVTVIDHAVASDAPIDDVIDLAENAVLSATDPDHVLEVPPFCDVVEGALDEIEAIGSVAGRMSGVPTGFADLDALTNGLQPGQLIVIGARPAMGKSTLGLDLLRACTVHNKLPAVLFTLELGRNEVSMRTFSAEARIALHHMRSGNMTDDDWTRLARRMPDVAGAPLYVDDSARTLTEIRSKCRRLKQKRGIKLIVIDYVQLLDYGLRQFASRYEEINEISRHLKLMAKELDIPVVAISQLNRGPEQRTDKRPQTYDLRDSGTLEDDADVLILLHREDAYDKESPRAGEADLIVAKHRNGPTATITVAFQGHYSRFVDMTRD
ncbi:replicative DNA helicase [Kitasatospora sp. NPDC093806]|uniref:replicative DNA helicase n=1 Tax=Kitasatospora sp. NPDC093806 TaxID=3155075 RepID=UPI003443734E